MDLFGLIAKATPRANLFVCAETFVMSINNTTDRMKKTGHLRLDVIFSKDQPRNSLNSKGQIIEINTDESVDMYFRLFEGFFYLIYRTIIFRISPEDHGVILTYTD